MRQISLPLPETFSLKVILGNSHRESLDEVYIVILQFLAEIFLPKFQIYKSPLSKSSDIAVS